jgi:hypothetical protein
LNVSRACFRVELLQACSESTRVDASRWGIAPAHCAGSLPCHHRRPREGGDPYAVCSRFGNVADAFLHNPRPGLWVPAFAGTTWMGDRDSHTPAFSRHTAPELCKSFRPEKREGAGKTGCALHPRSHVQRQTKNAHEHTGSAEAVRPSLRNGLTTYFVLSPARPELVCHRHRADTSAQLNTSHRGVRTTRLRRTLQPRSSVAAFASIAPRPNVSDDGQRPLSRDGMARNKRLIWVKSQG